MTIQPKKFIPGESGFANQTSDEKGFLRSFCPEGLCPREINEKEKNQYMIDGRNKEEKLGYQGVGGAREGYSTLLASIYPEGFTAIPRPIEGPRAPVTGGAGIFKLTGEPTSKKLEPIIRGAARAFEVPPEILAGVAWIEGGHMWNFNDNEVESYSAPGAQDPVHCAANGCGARGPMQFLNDGIATSCEALTGEVMPDVWRGYANAVNEATSGSRTPDICNITDSIYAAAKKLKSDSRATGANWTEEDVFRAGSGYYGSCVTRFDRLGNRSYCEFLWDNYR